MEVKGFNQAEKKKDEEKPKKVKVTKKSLSERVLETFFLRSLPKHEEGYVQMNRTTQELQDELEPMMTFTKFELNQYLDKHGYKLVTDDDGTVKWAIWRLIKA